MLLPAILAATLVAVSAPLARRLGCVAEVSATRWHQHGVIPRLSGPALLLAALPWLSAPMALALLGFCLVGLIDDLRPLSAASKALALVLPCGVAAVVTGAWWVAPACWVAANSINMLDHADGLAAATAGTALVMSGGESGAVLGGVCLGFLLHNLAPARTFLGDSGSLMLGAAVVMAWADQGAGPVLAGLAVPLMDTSFVVSRRLYEHRRPWIGGTDHLGHIALRRGIPPRMLPLLAAALTIAMISAGGI